MVTTSLLLLLSGLHGERITFERHLFLFTSVWLLENLKLHL